MYEHTFICGNMRVKTCATINGAYDIVDMKHDLMYTEYQGIIYEVKQDDVLTILELVEKSVDSIFDHTSKFVKNYCIFLRKI